MSALRVLITNIDLHARTGTAMYVRDLALKLQERNCVPIAYSPMLGDVSEELRRHGILTVSTLECLSDPPDVIHGHHSLQLMTALFRFPKTPAIFICHDFAAWHDTPPNFPRIRRYLAVDEACLDRLNYQHGIPSEKTRLLLNAVDLDRFQSRSELPDKPTKALLLSNNLEDQKSAPIRVACTASGIRLDSAGLKFGGTVRPETRLRNYDLVFAKGRCALEAVAVGACVVVCDATGVGPMVTSQNLERLRKASFGRRLMNSSLDRSIISERIDAFDPQDAAEASRRIRATAGIDMLVDQLLEIYQEVITEQSQSCIGTELEYSAAADFLQACEQLIQTTSKSLAKRYTIPGILSRWRDAALRGVIRKRDRILSGFK